MAGINRIDSLKKRKNELEQQIHEEEKRPSPDTSSLHRMKALKLSINDEITLLSDA